MHTGPMTTTEPIRMNPIRLPISDDDYGEQSMEVLECDACAALTLDAVRHADWHAEQVKA